MHQKDWNMNPKTILQRLFRRNCPSSNITDPRFAFYDIGFHGDQNLLAIVGVFAQECQCFIETGTNVGTTLAYVARQYPHLQCLSCEPDQAAYNHAVKNTRNLTNVRLFNQTSQEFLATLESQHQEVFSQSTFFWLDAHGYGFQWPLQTEIAFITSYFQAAYILIDDFLVPGTPVFGYDEYQGQICSFEYIKGSLNPGVKYHLYYPNYFEKTSQHHPLRGWGLIVYGHHTELNLPSPLGDKIQEEPHA